MMGRFVTYSIGETRAFPEAVIVLQGGANPAECTYVPHRTTTRHGVPCCECCGYGIGDERWHYCPSCGAEVVE